MPSLPSDGLLIWLHKDTGVGRDKVNICPVVADEWSR